MAKFNWVEITKEDVERAIKKFLADIPDYPEPKSTFLMYEGKKLPAKHIRGMAYTEHYGVPIRKDDFGGGMETVLFFERLGFIMEYHGKSDSSTWKKKVEKVKTEVIEIKKEIEPTVTKVDSQKKIDAVEKIKIPSKNVIEQKNALQLLLNKLCDGDVVCEKTFPWMKTPSEPTGIYERIYEAISQYRGDTSFAKKNVSLRCDFVCESKKLIIEYDERQHFTEARRLSLLAYNHNVTQYDRELWIKACSDIQAKDSNPVNRDEIRAYYDTVRDIEANMNGYRLIRIMHGQIDFEKPEAYDWLVDTISENKDWVRPVNLKVLMYLQTNNVCDQKSFAKDMEIVRQTEADILVFPEVPWLPFNDLMDESDIFSEVDREEIFNAALGLSKEIHKAVVVCGTDMYGTIFSVFANDKASADETKTAFYIKHTMTQCSAFEIVGYDEAYVDFFAAIRFKEYLIGLTICYDCNHSLFSRMYGLQGVDLILNSTGGNVQYNKWYKYNQVRSIENICYNLCTMGLDDANENSYVFGFNPNGKELIPTLINGKSEATNYPGGLYLYDLSLDKCEPGIDASLDQSKTVSKKQDFYIPVGNINEVLKKAECLDEDLYLYKDGNANIIIAMVHNEDIFAAEVILSLLYSKKLKGIKNKKYLLVARTDHISPEAYEQYLSVTLKVRAMENFCAVLLESDTINECYQTGYTRAVQVVQAENNMFGLDLNRMGGPEVIWKDKGGMKASWRKNFEVLIEKALALREGNQ